MLERYNGIEPDSEGAYVLHADAQATIADLQGQVEAARHDAVRKFICGEDKLCLVCGAKEPCELKDHTSSPCTFDPTPMELLRANQALQQRVAQLERERDDALHAAQGMSNDLTALGQKYEAELATLQADHARVLGLVQALGVVGLPAEHTRPDDFILLKTGEGWMAHTYNYWAKFATEEEARAYIALLEYRASLPAQPAQGGA